MEGSIGPVAGSSHHSIYQRMPGAKIISPMTPGEYQYAYEQFMKGDDVFYISEHRKSYDNTEELPNTIHSNADITLFPISITRFACLKAKEVLESQGVKVNVIHQLWIKPFTFHEDWKKALTNSKYGGIVLDDDYEEGAASSIAHRMMLSVNKRVETFCLNQRTAGFHPDVDNLPPTADEIVKRVLRIVREGK